MAVGPSSRIISMDLIDERKAREGEVLLPELVPFLDDGKGFLGPCLKHPLVFDIPFFPQMAWRCNDQYQQKRELLAKAVTERDWYTAIWLHERPFRAHAFAGLQSKMHHAEYWELLGLVWCDSENIWQWGYLAAELLGSRRPARRFMMDPEEREALAALPDTFTVYRGLTVPQGVKQGWSWTLDKDKAEWFSIRLIRKGNKPLVLTGEVRRSSVIAHLTRRGEAEIVVNPRDVLLPGASKHKPA